MNPDGVVYLDMASDSLQNGYLSLLNACWSPLYPSLLALFLFLWHPSPAAEFPVAHFLNWSLFVLALMSFGFFLDNWLPKEDAAGLAERGSVGRRTIVPFAFVLFLFINIQFDTLSVVAPDLCALSVVSLSAGIVCRMSSRPAKVMHFFALGCVLGIGYYVRAAMFPIAILLLLALFIFPPFPKHRRPWLFISLGAFFLVSAPLVLLVSKRVGHLSISENGNLNYLWHVNKVPPVAAAEDMRIVGTPIHPPRTLMRNPLTLEFSSSIGGTYPMHYDPSYWFDGLKARFDLRQQFAAVMENLLIVISLLPSLSGLLSGVFVLGILALTTGRQPSSQSLNGTVWLIVWPLGVFSLLVLVHIEPRYLAPFSLLFLLAVYKFLLSRIGDRVGKAVLLTVLCSLLPMLALTLAESGGRSVRDVLRPRLPDHLIIAEAIKKSGVRPTDGIIVVGNGYGAYYARLARAKIVAQVVDVDSFWRLSAADMHGLMEKVKQTGAKVLIAEKMPDGLSGEHWAVHGQWTEVEGLKSLKFSLLTFRRP